MRESPALDVIRLLEEQGAEVATMTRMSHRSARTDTSDTASTLTDEELAAPMPS